MDYETLCPQINHSSRTDYFRAASSTGPRRVSFLFFERFVFIFRQAFNCKGCQRWNAGKGTHKSVKAVQGTLTTAFCKGRVNVWLGVESLRLCNQYTPLSGVRRICGTRSQVNRASRSTTGNRYRPRCSERGAPPRPSASQVPDEARGFGRHTMG